jgi:uncharacterized membrane protein YwzB
MGFEILIPLAPFVMVIAIVWFASQARAKSNQAIQKTVQKAIEKGIELTPETVKALGVQPDRGPHRDLRSGMILIAVALGLVVMGTAIGFTDGDEEVMPILAGVAAIPGFIGLALIGMHIFIKNDKSE